MKIEGKDFVDTKTGRAGTVLAHCLTPNSVEMVVFRDYAGLAWAFTKEEFFEQDRFQPTDTAVEQIRKMMKNSERYDLISQAMLDGANDSSDTERREVLNGGLQTLETPITIEKFNEAIDAVLEKLRGK